MVHDQNTLVADAAVMRPQWLDKLAAFAEDIFRFIKLAEGIFERLEVRAGNLTVPEYLGHVS